ncbi:hypothetical protein [Algibacter mikhailovii]|uniref:SGNH/GDSL hydrolase family protein n=1 Tax=Algibacter mikhailovii TaxID=425498 RepID=A0A918QS62_9FLAO|nr:hypothetical protein [Algibacter mikhailovii]GGZ70494.1 hypothetical protein GCM10007028_04550 [Algibacter mikhailovii]
MKKLFIKSALYIILIIFTLEILVRVFHLYNETPTRYIDDFGVEKSLPNQNGYAVTGNRRQNFSQYHINKFGFNSYREFRPTKEKVEIAIIGDSFIEGMHQDFYNSTGKKLEEKLDNVEVYEYGYAGYDLANQLDLMSKYKEDFELIDHIVIYLKYENDLKNSSYTPNTERIALLSSPIFKIRNEFKLLSYASAIGVLDPIKDFVINIMKKKDAKKSLKEIEETKISNDLLYLENFKKLVATYGFDKQKVYFLLNTSKTSPIFLDYCESHGFQIFDFAEAFENSKKSPTLIYDKHWNNHGRELIAEVIYNNLKDKL